MAGILSSIATGTKAGTKEVASNVMESVYSSGLFGAVLKNVVEQFQEPEKPKQVRSLNTSAQTLLSLEKYFVQISDNIYNIATAMGAQVTSMHEIEQMLDEQREQNARDAEEAATKARPDKLDATKVLGEESEKGGTLGTLANMFKGKSLPQIISDFGTSIAGSVASFGARIIALLNPIGMVASIVAAIGYGVFQYFTNDEFKSIIDTGIQTLWDTVKDAAQSIVEFFPRLVKGGIEFLSSLWDTLSTWVSNAWDAIKSGVKSFFGFGEKKKSAPAEATPAPPPTEAPAAKPAVASTTAAAPAAAPPAPPVAPAGGAPTSALSSVSTAHAQAMPQPQVAGAGPVPAGEAGDLEKNTTKADSGVNLSGLVAAFKSRLAGLATDFQQMTGKKLVITSGFRDPEKQKALYAADPAHAAPPGRSPHEIGTAVDINSPDANKADELGLLAKYHLFRPLANRAQNPEPWHVEPFERKALASAGDGGVVPGSSNASAVDPGTGKPIPIPPSPDTGQNIASASQTNQQAVEQRQKQPTNVIVNNSRIQFNNIALTSLASPAACEPRSLSPLGA